MSKRIPAITDAPRAFPAATRLPADERSVAVALTTRGLELKSESRCLGEAVFARTGMAPAAMIALNRKARDLHEALTSR